MVGDVVRRFESAFRRMLVIAAVGAIVLALPAAVAADVDGGCTLTGTSTSGGPVDLTSTQIWHLQSTDQISGTATAPDTQWHATVDASVLGIGIPVVSGASEGATHADSELYSVSTLAAVGRVLVLTGTSTGPHAGCSGQIEVIIDDVNPLLTVMGGGGAAGIVLGLLGLALAVRKPASGRRMVLATAAGALVGAGSALVLQQTLAGAASDGFASSAFVDAVAAPANVSLDPTTLLQTAILTLVVVVLLPFPAELFNRTLEENLDEVRGWVRRLPLAGRMVGPASPSAAQEPMGPAAAGRSNLLMIGVFVLVAGLLYLLLDPQVGPDVRGLVTYAGIVLALVVTTWAANLPLRAIHRQTGDRGRLHAVPGTLFVAAACVLLSRAVGFLPGYLYGLILGWQFARQLDGPEDGRAHALGAWWMLGLAVVAWFTFGAVRGLGIDGTAPAAVTEAILAALVVAGIEGIVFGLLPLRFLKGAPVFRWRKWLWALLYAIGLFAFILVLINPANGLLTPSKQTNVVTAIGLFLVFGLISVLFWGYFRFRPARPTPG